MFKIFKKVRELESAIAQLKIYIISLESEIKARSELNKEFEALKRMLKFTSTYPTTFTWWGPHRTEEWAPESHQITLPDGTIIETLGKPHIIEERKDYQTKVVRPKQATKKNKGQS